MHPAMRAVSDEAHDPKYAQFERERRWLVEPSMLPDLPDRASLLVEDRYISGTRFRLRRLTDSMTGTATYKLTRKYESSDPRARPIVTAYLSADEYTVFAALPAYPLTKRRWKLPSGEADYNVDVFLGPLEGLTLTEIEWPDDAGLRALAPPLWAGREVTDDIRYEGGTLAVSGIPKE